MSRKSRGLLGIEAAIILIAIVLVSAFLAYSVINIGSTSVGQVKTTIGTGLTQASSSLQASGTILGLMCLEGGTGCGEHSSLGMISYPIKLGAGGTPVDLDFSNTVVKYLSNSVEFDDIYNGTVDVEIPIVVVMDSGNSRVQLIDSDGSFINEFGSFGAGLGQFNNAFGIEVTPSGVIYVADRLNFRIQVFDSSGNNPFSFGSAGVGDGQFGGFGPFDVSYDPTRGNAIVTDPGNSRIQIFDSSGNYLSQFPTSAFPLRVSTDGTFIYVAVGFALQQVEVYDFNGNLQFTIPGLANPVGIEVTGNSIIVSEIGSHEVEVFDLNGNPRFTIGGFGAGPGQFNSPWEVDADSSGNIYVVDSGNNRVQIFDSTGNYISEFGGIGGGPGQLSFPLGLAVVSYSGDPTTSVGIAAGRGLITTSNDSTYGSSASNTGAWIFFPVSNSQHNSVLEQGEHGVIGIAPAAQDRPGPLDKIRIELLTASGGTYTVSVQVPTTVQSITELG